MLSLIVKCRSDQPTARLARSVGGGRNGRVNAAGVRPRRRCRFRRRRRETGYYGTAAAEGTGLDVGGAGCISSSAAPAGAAAIIGGGRWTESRGGTLARDAAVDRRGRRASVGGAADLGSRPARALHQHAARLQAAERDVGRLVDAGGVLHRRGGGRFAAALDGVSPAAPVDRVATSAGPLGCGRTVICTYTGVLIGATAIPAWNRNVSVLPLHFAASGVGPRHRSSNCSATTTRA